MDVTLELNDELLAAADRWADVIGLTREEFLREPSRTT